MQYVNSMIDFTNPAQSLMQTGRFTVYVVTSTYLMADLKVYDDQGYAPIHYTIFTSKKADFESMVDSLRKRLVANILLRLFTEYWLL